MQEMKINAIAPWFGSNRLLAHEVGAQLTSCEWVGIPFAGGMSEVPHIAARTILVNDLHRLIINLARVTSDPVEGPKIYRRLRRIAFHPDELQAWRASTARWEEMLDKGFETEAAISYFVCVWMGRSAKAGTKNEFDGGLPIRWNAGGGDSAVRYQNAARSLNAWRRTLRRCTFTTLDFREFLRNCLKHDKPKHGIYSDSPFKDATDEYEHTFTDKDHRELAELLTTFTQARVVCRFYEHPLVAELYPASRWRKISLVGRKQSNEVAPEILLVKLPG